VGGSVLNVLNVSSRARAAKTVIAILSAAIAAGLVAGLASSIDHVLKNQYLQHRMLPIALLDIQASVLGWSVPMIISAYLMVGLTLCVFAAVGRRGGSIPPSVPAHCRGDVSRARASLAAVVSVALLLPAWVYLRRGLSNDLHTALTAGCGFLAFGVLLRLLSSRRGIGRGTRVAARGAMTLTVLASVLALGVPIASTVRGGRGPNLVLVVIDCLRPDHLGCYGCSRDTSPRIDKLARSATVFRNVYSNAPHTKPSVASMFTSLHANSHNAVRLGDVLPEEALTLAELLKNAGYHTCFINGGNSMIGEGFGFRQGFDYYRYVTPDSAAETTRASSVTHEFTRHLRWVGTKRFFAYVHYMDLHIPYHNNRYNEFFAPTLNRQLGPGQIWPVDVRGLPFGAEKTDEVREHLVALYDGQIRFVDESIAAIVRSLEEHDLLRRTLVVITADHGEEFWEHRNFEHGHTLYDELLHVPLIMFGNHMGRADVETRVQLVDVLPTFCELAGAPLDRLRPVGRSLLGALGRPAPQGPSRVFATGTLYGDEKFCLIQNGAKLIINTGETDGKCELTGWSSDSRFELYKLGTDPGERDNLVDREPGLVHALEQSLTELAGQTSPFQRRTTSLDKRTREALQALGYVRPSKSLSGQ
jgi:choline-sulfatase